MRCYIASGFFNEHQLVDLKIIKEALHQNRVEYYSPMDKLVCPPDAPKEVRRDVFVSNIQEIQNSDFIICNTRDKDIGAIFEAGVAYSTGVPIIYYFNAPKGVKFNLMLSESGAIVTKNLLQLCDAINNLKLNPLYTEEYKEDIE